MARQTQSTERPRNRSRGAATPSSSGERDASVNRAASHNYFLMEKFEAGIALRGTEVKSIRAGRANLKDAYGLVKDGELWLINAHIGAYEHGNIFNHEPLRTRKLLVHKNELHKLIGKTQQKGLTLIPTRLYFRNGRVKVELALAKGKQTWDKRETERRRTPTKKPVRPSPAAARRSRVEARAPRSPFYWANVGFTELRWEPTPSGVGIRSKKNPRARRAQQFLAQCVSAG